MNSLRSLLLALMASLALASNSTNSSTTDDASSSSDTNTTTIAGTPSSSSSSTDDNSTTTTTTTTTVAGNTTTTTTTTTVAAGNTTTTTTTTTAADTIVTTTTTVAVNTNTSNETTGASTQVLQTGLVLTQTVQVPDTVRAKCTEYLAMSQIFTFSSKTYLAHKTSQTDDVNNGNLPNCKDDGTLPAALKCLKHMYTDETKPAEHVFDAWKISKGYDTIQPSSCTATAITLSRQLSNKRRLSTGALTRGDDIAIVYAQNGNTEPAFATAAKAAVATVVSGGEAAIATDLATTVSLVSAAFKTGDTSQIAVPTTVSSTGAKSAGAPSVSSLISGNADEAVTGVTLPASVDTATANVTITVSGVTALTGAVTPASTTSGSVSNGVATAVLAAVAGATMVMAF